MLQVNTRWLEKSIPIEQFIQDWNTRNQDIRFELDSGKLLFKDEKKELPTRFSIEGYSFVMGQYAFFYTVSDHKGGI